LLKPIRDPADHSSSRGIRPARRRFW
jgi:hypothetical protein